MRLQHEILHNPSAKVDDLPYLDAVLEEGLRLFPSIPMTLPRYVPEGGRTIGGYTLPAGSMVSCQAFSIHRLNGSVFPDAEIFAPERCLQKEGELERNRLFFAFAAGGRGCIGKKYVMSPTLIASDINELTVNIA
jgi:cytochrome P450